MSSKSDQKSNQSHSKDHLISTPLTLLDQKMMMKQIRGKKLVNLVAILCVLCVASFVVVADRVDADGASSASFESMPSERKSILRSKKSAVSMPKMAMRESMEMGMETAEESDFAMATTATSTSASLGSDFREAFDDAIKEADQKLTDVVNRMLVYNGNIDMQSSKDNFDSLVSKVEDKVTNELKGYIESKNQYTNAEWEHHRRHVNLQVRIPGKDFEKGMKLIQSLAEEPSMIGSVSVNSRDVTDEYVDSSSRAATLEASHKALRSLMDKAKDVKEVLRLQEELNRLTMQIESNKQRATRLKKDSVMSSLSIQLSEKLPKAQQENKHVSIFPFHSVNLAIEHMMGLAGMIADILMYAAVWLLPLGLILCVGSLCLKRNK